MTSHETAIEAVAKAISENAPKSDWPTKTELEVQAKAAVSAYLKEMGSEAVAWTNEAYLKGPRSDSARWASRIPPSKPDDPYTIPLFLAPSEDIEKLKAERDEANERCAAAVDDYNVQLAGHRLSVKQSTENLLRAVAAEAERDAKAALLEEARNALTKIRDGYGPNHLSKYARDVAGDVLSARLEQFDAK